MSRELPMTYKRSFYSLTAEELRVGALILFLSYSAIRSLSSYVGMDINLVGYIIVFVMYTLFGISLFMSKPAGFKEAVLFIIGILLVLLFTIVLFPENGNVISKVFGLQHGPIIILFICSIYEAKNINKCIIAHAYISIIQMCLGLITYIKNGGYWLSTYEGNIKYANYNMSVGYYATFAAMLFILQYVNDKKTYKLVLSIILVAISIVFGARGCVLCYIVLFILSYNRLKLTRKQLLFVFFLILVALFIYVVGVKNVILYIINLLKRYGLESRTLNQIAIGSTTSINSSGRDELWQIVIQKIGERPFLGYGVLGEQHFFEMIYGNAFYAHNIILEILVSFGVPIGTVVIAVLVYNSFKAKKILRDTVLEISYLTLLSYNIGNLMVSNSYWYSTNFWIMVGLILIALSRRNLLHVNTETTM